MFAECGRTLLSKPRGLSCIQFEAKQWAIRFNASWRAGAAGFDYEWCQQPAAPKLTYQIPDASLAPPTFVTAQLSTKACRARRSVSGQTSPMKHL
jgi:hypothetical protein